jgi:ABC-type Fe3+/spermidine/putrescine transport system ATPase subunit
MPNVGLELVSVSKSFGGREVVDRLSLRLPKGKLLTLLGPSGCGKTTMLRMIAGFVEPSSGQVFIDGEDVTRVLPERRPTSIMFQSYALFPHMTVFENVAFGLQLRRVRGAEMRRRVTELLELVHLETFMERYPGQLSGGQQQRTALARSLVIGPKVLLLDEPFAALDRDLRERMQIELRKLQQELGITMVVVTHDQHEAMVLSDYVAVMNEGRIDQLDEPSVIYNRPRTRFVAGFMGIPNILPAKLDRSVARTSIALGSFVLPFMAEDVPAGTDNAVTIALRREEILLRPVGTKTQPDQGKLTGTVRFARQIGSQTAYEVETDAGHIHVLSARQEFTPDTGTEVALIIPVEHIVAVTP